MRKFALLYLMLVCIGSIAASRLKYEKGLVIPITSIDLGEKSGDQPFKFDIELINSGSQAIRIHGLKPSCGCTIVSQRSFDLQPNTVKKIEVTVDPSGISKEVSGILTVYHGNPVISTNVDYHGKLLR